MACSVNAVILGLLFAAVTIILLTPARSQISVGFEKENYVYTEANSFHVINLVKRPAGDTSQRFLIGIQVVPESAQLDVDLSFSGLAPPLAMESDKNKTSLSFYIFDDQTVEFNETILLISSVPPGAPNFECKKEDGCHQSTRITIVDNDGLVVGFESTSLEVSENAGKIKICVRINPPSSALTGIQPFNLIVKTNIGAADLRDFLPTNQSLEGFGNSVRRQCFNVTITDDAVREDAETFTVTLEKPGSLPTVLLHPGIITVTINDNDGVILGFERETYSTSEGNSSIEVCVQVKSGVLQSFLHLSLTTMDGSATASVDYTSKSVDLMFGPSNNKRCVLIPVTNDMVPEVPEHFSVMLSMVTPLAGVILTPDNASVVINDDDVILGFDRETYSTGEGNSSIEVCVQVKSGVLQSSLHLSLTTVDGSATASVDYTSKSVDLMFGPSDNKRCVLIPVTNDMVPEVPEHFSVVLSMTTPLAGVILTPDNATVVINDDDVILGFDRETYSTGEGNSSIEVCVQVKSGVLQSSLHLSLTTVDGSATASADYTSKSVDLMFGPSKNKRCVLIPVTNDMVPEAPEHFSVVLSVTIPLAGVILTPDNATVVINDDDVILGFERETYSTGEGNISIEVCVQVKSGVLQSSLHLSLTTVDGSATASADYTSKSVDLMFGPSNNKRCVLIPVTNDMVPEVPEHFSVVLSMATPLANVILTPDNASIVINDDDVAPEPEVGCTIELFVLAATREKEQQKVVETVQEILPGILPTSNSTANDTTSGGASLTRVYNSLTEEFGVNKSDSGYSKFVEAINEITEAKQEACSGDVRPGVGSIPRLVQEFRAVLNTTQRDLLRLRTIFGKMLCIKDEIKKQKSKGRERRQEPIPECGGFGTPCFERTPEECACPPGGLDSDCIVCTCEFFRCLDPDDVLKPILGFVAEEIQCLAFVVDTTGSMRDEIAAAQEIIRSFIKSEEELNEIGCYILMPFNDVDDIIEDSVGPITVAHTDQHVELQEFLRAVDNLHNGAYHGGDCEEYALDGILQTLKATGTDEYGNKYDLMAAGSQIIVLTDAPSKNIGIQERVTDSAEEQSVCIHFFLALETGNCFDVVPDSVDMYRRIAQKTGGTVVSNAWQFSNFVASHSCADFYGLTYRKRRSAFVDSRCQSFRVSRFTNLLKLSVRPSATGLRTVTVRKPSGSTATPHVIEPYSNNRFAVFSEVYPESGEWSVCVNSGMVEVFSNAETTLDVVVLYPKNESHSSGAVPTTSNSPPACTGGRIAVVTSRSAEMSSAYVNILGRNRTVVAHIPLSKCSEFLVGNTTFPLGTFIYELGGEDQDGNPFVYNSRKNVTFGPGSSYYAFSAVNGTSLEIDYNDIFSLTYELNNTNPYGSVTFNFAAEPVDGFSRFLRPLRATVGAGESVQVTITASVGSSRIRRGSSHTFTVTATSNCTTLSASKTVNIRAPPPTTPPPADLCGCQNGGTCIVLVRRGRQFPRCSCPSGYRGTKCQIIRS